MIDRLEELLDHSTRMPMTSRVMIDEDEYLRLIDQMRISVPQEIKNARQIEAERDAILAAAQEQAEAMIAAAREKADSLSDDHIVLAQAEERASEVLSQAYEEAASIRSDADAYALEVLERIAAQLEGFNRMVVNGIQLLQSGRSVPGQATMEGELDRQVAGDRHVPGDSQLSIEPPESKRHD